MQLLLVLRGTSNIALLKLLSWGTGAHDGALCCPDKIYAHRTQNLRHYSFVAPCEPPHSFDTVCASESPISIAILRPINLVRDDLPTVGFRALSGQCDSLEC